MLARHFEVDEMYIPWCKGPRSRALDLAAVLTATLRGPVERTKRIVEEAVHVRVREEGLVEESEGHC